VCWGYGGGEEEGNKPGADPGDSSFHPRRSRYWLTGVGIWGDGAQYVAAASPGSVSGWPLRF